MKICVFCSAKLDFSQQTIDACRLFAKWIGENDHTLVYGGAKVGLMGLMADEVLASGGKADGYMPRGLFSKEIPHLGLTNMYEVPDLMERKRQMMESSDLFVILPGGVGTLDEFFEVLTWKSLNCFNKPILVFNLNGFWDSLLAMIEDLHQKKVLTDNLIGCFETCTTLDGLKERMC